MRMFLKRESLLLSRGSVKVEEVVDHIIGLAKVSDKTVSKEELFKPLDDENKA